MIRRRREKKLEKMFKQKGLTDEMLEQIEEIIGEPDEFEIGDIDF